MSEFNVVLADHPGLGRVHMCGCNSVHLKIGPVTVCLAPEVFAQMSIMVREAMEELAKVEAAPYKIAYSDWPGYTVLEVAKQKGWFKDAGLDVELVWFEYSPSIDAFAAGKIDGVTIVAGDDMVTGAVFCGAAGALGAGAT